MKTNKKNGLRGSLWQKVLLLILSIAMTLLILEISLRMGGAAYGVFQEQRNRLAMKQKGVYRILCVGESTTAFYRVKKPYPVFLEELLNHASAGVQFSVINKGEVSAGTSDIVAHLENNLETYKPDMVIAMMGINDCGYLSYKVRPSSGPEFFWSHFRAYNLLRLLWCRYIKKSEEIQRPKAVLLETRGVRRVSSGAREFRMQRGRGGGQSARQGASAHSPEEDPAVPQGLYYQGQGNFDLAEKSFKEALSHNAENCNAYLKLGWLYQRQGASLQAEEFFKKAIQIHPDEADAFFGLASASQEQDKSKYSQAEESFKKAIELDPYHAEYYLICGFYYRNRVKKYALAEECFKKAMDLMPEKYAAYRELGRTYSRQGKFQQAEALFKEFQSKYPDNDRIYQDLIQLLEEKGQSEKAVELGKECFRNVTAENYIKMEGILSKKKIKLVCVQYPMREISSLKEVFKGTEGIIFVDNEKIFKERVNKDTYGEYFIDNMFGDFGHCTKKGNELLAGNIVRIILKEVFGKRLRPE